MPEETLNEIWRDIYGDLITDRSPPESAAVIARRALETHTETLKALRALAWEPTLPDDYRPTITYRQNTERDRLHAAQRVCEDAQDKRPVTDEAIAKVAKLLHHTQEQNESLKAFYEKYTGEKSPL